MDQSDWASEHLQVIRTLMERSAVYRRALAPIMLVAGALGIAGSILACFAKLETNREFSLFWLSVGVLAVIAALLLVRRQALKEAEPFWSPPTRRVGRAVLPAFLVGLCAAALYIISPKSLPESAWIVAIVWVLCYGLGLHAAGFFAQRGIKLLGWIFVISGVVLFFALEGWSRLQSSQAAHYVMGIFFGLIQLSYGIYLYFTEKRRSA